MTGLEILYWFLKYILIFAIAFVLLKWISCDKDCGKVLLLSLSIVVVIFILDMLSKVFFRKRIDNFANVSSAYPDIRHHIDPNVATTVSEKTTYIPEGEVDKKVLLQTTPGTCPLAGLENKVTTACDSDNPCKEKCDDNYSNDNDSDSSISNSSDIYGRNFRKKKKKKCKSKDKKYTDLAKPSCNYNDYGYWFVPPDKWSGNSINYRSVCPKGAGDCLVQPVYTDGNYADLLELKRSKRIAVPGSTNQQYAVGAEAPIKCSC